MDAQSSSGEDDITYRRKKRTKHLTQRTQNDTDSEGEKILETSVKIRVRNRKCVFKESDNSESDNQSEHAEKVLTEDAKCSLVSQARTTKSPTAIPEGNQFEGPSPEPTVSKRKTRNLIKQEKIKSLQENDDESGFKMDSLLSKHSDLFDCESDNDDLTPAPSEEWHEKNKPVKQKKEPKTARLNKKEQFKLHSEAQRVVRESNISLPKYQPKVKTLDDFLKKLKSGNSNNIKPSLSIKRLKEPAQSEESLTSKPVSDGSNLDNAISLVAICQEESSSVLSASLQGKTAAVTNRLNDGEASQDVLPGANPSMSQKDALLHNQDSLLHNQDSVLMELDNSQCSNTIGATKFMHFQVKKAVKDVPAPKLCSHTEWEETQVVSPVEELQKRLVKHASIISPEVVEDSVLTRDEWKSILYKQVSERRASERKAIDEVTKLDNEEFSPAESEAELTDEESIASGHEKEENEKAIDEGDEISKEDIEEKNGEEESQTGWQSDFNGSFSDEDNVDDDGVEGDDSEDDEENSDDELIVKSKKLTKQLESDSDSETPSQFASKPTTPIIRNFPFDKEMSAGPNQTSELNNIVITKENLSCKDGDKKEIDSGLGTSLLADASSDIDNSIVDGNPSKVDNVAMVRDDTPKRPSEDDTNMTIESNSLLSNATELDRSSRSASNSICRYDEETQFLDSNGFLNIKQKSKQPPALELDDSAVSSQLIQLCSGQFSPKNGDDNNKLLPTKPVDLDQSFLLQRKDSKDLPTTQGVRELLGFKEPTSSKPLSKSIGSMLLESSHCDGDNSQLLALCSGNFSSQFTSFPNTKHHQQTSDGMTDEGDISSDDGDELMMLTNGRRLVTNSNHTPVMNTNNEDSDDEMPRLSKRRNRKYLKNKEKSMKRRRLEEFVESEAELSGSDYGMASDEERAYLDNEEDEVLERLSGDSEINMSEDELKKQVNRVHMKYTLADDSANIKDIKERFLPGGDLYEDGIMLKDGFFRKRKFAHVGSETSLDLFADDRVLDSGDEQFNDENSQAEAMRRKQRLEKEEFLSQMRQHDSLLDDENSQQLLKLVKPAPVKISGTAPLNKRRPATVQLHSSKTLKNSCGSFLKRNKDDLSKLSLSVASTTTVNLSSSKNFVFQTGTTPTAAGQSERTTPQLKKSHSVKSKPGKSPRKTAYKRSQSLPQDEDSIFNILNNL